MEQKGKEMCPNCLGSMDYVRLEKMRENGEIFYVCTACGHRWLFTVLPQRNKNVHYHSQNTFPLKAPS